MMLNFGAALIPPAGFVIFLAFVPKTAAILREF
jgi:hypothetical protein